MPSYFQKSPNEVLNFTVDYALQLTQDGGTTISSSTWAISPSGELTEDSETEGSTSATIWVSGGVEGSTYEVTNTVVTSGGQEYERTIIIEVMTLPRP